MEIEWIINPCFDLHNIFHKEDGYYFKLLVKILTFKRIESLSTPSEFLASVYGRW